MAPCRSSAMSSIESAPATIPATSAVTFPPGLAPLSVGTLSSSPANASNPAGPASRRTAEHPPAHPAHPRGPAQPHHRHQPRRRHEIRLVEPCCNYRPAVRESHLRDALRARRTGTLAKSDSVATQGHSHVPPRPPSKIIGGSRLNARRFHHVL